MLLRKTSLMVCVLLVSAYASAQNITITGNVSDNTGPVVGVTVVVRGTVSIATTDLDGNYSITAPSTATLTFSSLGYKTVEVPVNGRTRLDVSMEEEAFILEDLVVVGFGTQKKVNLTGAVSSVNVQEALTSRPIADVGRALQGSTPGLTVQVGSGEVGSEAIMKIRGHVGSAAGSVSPLILLDNVEIPSIQLVNPDDIESISVLKDAASASIYGSKAAFGVILITTKKGAKTESVSVNYSGNVSFQNMSKKFEMAGVDALHYTVEAAERIGTTTPVGAFWLIDRAGYNAAVAWDKKYGNSMDPYEPMVYGRDWYVDASNRKIGVRTYDPYNYLIREWAPTQNHNLSVTGKSGKTNFNIGVGYLDQNGMMKTAKQDDFQRWNASARVSSQINKFLSVHAGLMYSKTQKRWAYATSSTTADIWYYMYRWGPTFPMAASDESGNPLRNATYETAVANTASITNNYTSANAGLTITPVKDWNINLDYTYSNQESIELNPGTSFMAGDTWVSAVPLNNQDGTRIYRDNEWNQYNSLGASIPAYMLNYSRYTAPGSNPDHIYRSASNRTRSTLNLTTTYDLNVNDAHIFNFMLGMNVVAYDYNNSWSQKLQLMDYTNPQFDLASGTQTSGGNSLWDSQLGFFGRINYNFKERYLFEANLRYDGTSKFPKDLQWRWYPSFSFGWRVMEEPWMDFAKPALTSLKLRGSWGSIGDQSVSNTLYVPTMSGANSYWLHGGARDTYFGTPAAVSSIITWQDIVTLNVGVDISILNGALSASLDWYQRDTKNMIVPGEGFSYTFGTTAPQGNFGSLRTNGWEVSLNFGHQFASGFRITASAAFSDAVTHITKYGSTTSINAWYEGKVYGEIWGYQVDRLYQNDDFVYENGKLVTMKSTDGYTVNKLSDPNAPTQGKLQTSSNFRFGPGDVKFKDLNGDGVINNGSQLIDDYGDLSVIGNTTPRYEYSFRLGMEYKGVDFSVFFQGVGKRDMWGASPLAIPGFNSSDGAMPKVIAQDFWYETYDGSGNVIDSNYDAFYPRAYNLGASSTGNNMQVCDRYLLNMAYLRMKNLTIGYTMPRQLTRKAMINNVRIYISLENFLTFDKLRGLPIDPEEIAGYSLLNTSNYNSSRTGVGVPTFKSASVGLQLTF